MTKDKIPLSDELKNEDELKLWEENLDAAAFDDEEETDDAFAEVIDPKTELLSSIGSVPIMKKDEFLDCHRKYKETGDKRYRNMIVEGNMRLVPSIVKRYRNSKIPFNDLVQEGMFGLITAAERFDESFECTFSTYATWWIRQNITRYVQNYEDFIRIPVHSSEKIFKIEKLMDLYSIKFGRKPTKEEIYDLTGITRQEYLDVKRLPECNLSLDREVLDSDGDSDTTFMDYLAVDDGPGPEEKYLSEELKEVVRKNMERLTERERKILILRFGLDDENMRTLSTVATRFGVSRERIRGLEMRALRKLKRCSELREYAER